MASEEPVHSIHIWPRPLALEHGESPSEGEDLESGIGTTAKDDSERTASIERMNLDPPRITF